MRSDSSSVISIRSPAEANGALNHCSKLSTELKMLGNKKFNKDHSSGKEFYRIRGKLDIIIVIYHRG
jgi:hypothetical protein